LVLADLERRPELLEVPAVRVYASCYRAVVAGRSEEDFRTLRRVIAAQRDHFPKHEMRDIYLLAINYCIRALNAGRRELLSDIQQLYRESLEQGYLLEDGHLPESTFTNMIALHLKLGHFDEGAHIMETYAQDLPAATRESILHFNRARWYHAQGQADTALPLLARVDTNAPYLYLGAKSLQLRIFYEQGSYAASESILQQLRQYLHRRKDLGYRQENYRLLVQFFRQLLSVSAKDKKAVDLLIEKVQAAPTFAEKVWLLAQLERL
ncbi:MAG: hypothetical protein AAGJ82_15970, partial [Bacteroidota bacterium]